MKQLYSTFSHLLNDWGSDTPPEVIWSLNDLLQVLEEEYNHSFNGKQFKEDDPNNDNDLLLEEIDKLFTLQLYDMVITNDHKIGTIIHIYVDAETCEVETEDETTSHTINSLKLYKKHGGKKI